MTCARMTNFGLISVLTTTKHSRDHRRSVPSGRFKTHHGWVDMPLSTEIDLAARKYAAGTSARPLLDPAPYEAYDALQEGGGFVCARARRGYDWRCPPRTGERLDRFPCLVACLPSRGTSHTGRMAENGDGRANASL